MEILLWCDFYNKLNNEVKLILIFYLKKNVIKVKGLFLKNVKCVKVILLIIFDWYWFSDGDGFWGKGCWFFLGKLE